MNLAENDRCGRFFLFPFFQLLPRIRCHDFSPFPSFFPLWKSEASRNSFERAFSLFRQIFQLMFSRDADKKGTVYVLQILWIFIFYVNLIFNRSFPLLQYLCDSEIYTRRKFVLIIYYSSSRTSKRRLRSRCKSKQGHDLRSKLVPVWLWFREILGSARDADFRNGFEIVSRFLHSKKPLSITIIQITVSNSCQGINKRVEEQ